MTTLRRQENIGLTLVPTEGRRTAFPLPCSSLRTPIGIGASRLGAARQEGSVTLFSRDTGCDTTGDRRSTTRAKNSSRQKNMIFIGAFRTMRASHQCNTRQHHFGPVCLRVYLCFWMFPYL